MDKPQRPLNPRQIAFCQAYAQHGNATKAYLEAGYKVTEKVAQVQASKMLLNPMVQAEIKKLAAPAQKKAEVTIERITEELARIAFSGMDELVEISEGGKIKVKPEADLKLLDSVNFSESFDAKGGYSSGFSFKKSDKLKALDMLLKISGGYERSPDSDAGNLKSNSGRILEALRKLRGKQ